MTTSTPVTPEAINQQLDDAASNALPQLIENVNSYLEQNYDETQLTVDISPYVNGIDRRVVNRLSALIVKQYRQRWEVKSHADVATHIVFSPKAQ